MICFLSRQHFTVAELRDTFTLFVKEQMKVLLVMLSTTQAVKITIMSSTGSFIKSVKINLMMSSGLSRLGDFFSEISCATNWQCEDGNM